MSASEGWAAPGADECGADDDGVAVVKVKVDEEVVVVEDKSSPPFKAMIEQYAARYSDAGIMAERIAGVTGCAGSETTASPEAEVLTDLSLSYCSRAKVARFAEIVYLGSRVLGILGDKGNFLVLAQEGKLGSGMEWVREGWVLKIRSCCTSSSLVCSRHNCRL